MTDSLAHHSEIPGQNLEVGDNQILFGSKMLNLSLSARAMQALNAEHQPAHIDIELEPRLTHY